MPVLRDLVARLSLDFDDKSFDKAEGSIGGVKNALSGLGAALTAGAVVIGFNKVIGLASDANETLNVLNASFGEQSKEVQAWASQFASAAGRSEFELREMAGTLGAVLNPMMDRNQEAAAEMSTTFAALAVDLGSFFNAADTEVLEALRSGLTGEAEPLKRFGVVMNEAMLEAFALSEGIDKSVKSMTNAEKTALRYNFILDQTVNAQGDATKTASGWANASKGLGSAFKDLGTEMGLILIPAAEKVLNVMKDATRGFTDMAKESNILQAALIVLGGVLTVIAVKMVIAFWPVILTFLAIAAVVAAVMLVVDDFITFLQGGDSVIGRFIDSIFGEGSATAAAEGLKTAWEAVSNFFKNTLWPAFKELGERIKNFVKFMIADWNAFFDRLNEIGVGISNFIFDFKKHLKTGMDVLSKFGDEVLNVLNEAGKFFGLGDLGLGIEHKQGAGGPSVARGRAGIPQQTVNTDVKVTVEGNATPETANKVGRAAARGAASGGRGTLNSLTQKAPA